MTRTTFGFNCGILLTITSVVNCLDSNFLIQYLNYFNETISILPSANVSNSCRTALGNGSKYLESKREYNFLKKRLSYEENFHKLIWGCSQYMV